MKKRDKSTTTKMPVNCSKLPKLKKSSLLQQTDARYHGKVDPYLHELKTKTLKA